MDIDKIKYILENFNSFKWDSQNYNNFINQVKMLDSNTLDDDMKLKVNSFLQYVQKQNNQNTNVSQNTTIQQNLQINSNNDSKEINSNTEISNKKQEVIRIIIPIIIVIAIMGFVTLLYLNGIFDIKKDPQNSTNNNNSNNSDASSKLFSITDTITTSNNLFEYKNYKYEYDEEFESAFIWLGTLTNISTKTLQFNIRIKFYDINKNCIGDYQYKTESSLEDIDSIWTIAPSETKNPSFTIYNDDLYDNKTLNDVEYLSIEDIIFNEQ